MKEIYECECGGQPEKVALGSKRQKLKNSLQGGLNQVKGPWEVETCTACGNFRPYKRTEADWWDKYDFAALEVTGATVDGVGEINETPQIIDPFGNVVCELPAEAPKSWAEFLIKVCGKE